MTRLRNAFHLFVLTQCPSPLSQIMRELESGRENKENQPAATKLRPCDTNVGIGSSGKRMRSAGDEEDEAEHLAGLWGEVRSPSKLLTG